jgi:hypothetical protein
MVTYYSSIFAKEEKGQKIKFISGRSSIEMLGNGSTSFTVVSLYEYKVDENAHKRKTCACRTVWSERK